VFILSDSYSLSDLLSIDSDGSDVQNNSDDQRRLVEISIHTIIPNTFQPRKDFDQEQLQSLSDSIKQLGILQPILVRSLENDSYELIAGERRWRAAKIAGLTTVPAIVSNLEDLASLEQAIVENLHRSNLNPIDEAEAYQRLIDDFDLTQSMVATRMGKSRSAIANSLRLLSLPRSIIEQIRSQYISFGHAKVLLQLSNETDQINFSREIIDNSLSVRSLEKLIKSHIQTKSVKSEYTKNANVDYGYLEVESQLSDLLATTVKVDANKSKGTGKLVIEFADTFDLNRIFNKINKEK